MSPEERIASLDRSLADVGEDVILRRVVGTAPNQLNVDVTCRAKITAVTTEQIVANIAQTELNFIMSPTQINTAQWPGGSVSQTPPFNPDQRIPKINIDKMVVRGALRSITFVDPVIRDNVLVRINGRAG